MLAAMLLALATGASAHDIPNDVTVHAFFKPEGNRLRVLVRVPLKTMRDIEFPTRDTGFLDLSRIDTVLPDAATLWISDAIEVLEDDAPLPAARIAVTRISLESDKSFTSYEEALRHVTGPKLPDYLNVVWNQVMFDVMFEYPIHSDRARFSIHPLWARLGHRVVTVLRFLPPGGTVRAFELEGDPGLIRLDPRWYQAAGRFIEGGFFHILDGTDHLLFLFCLVIPFRRFRALVPVVTAFTVAHSITLIASAYDLAPGALWFPPLIEMMIAVSIVYMALENIAGAESVPRRWMIAFGFGLVHGFGFSFALRQTLQFAGSHLLTSLLSFNIGVELGQLFMLLLFIPAIEGLFRFVVAERMGTIILSALVAHTGWHWMTERYDKLSQFRFEWPALTTTFFLTTVRWLILAVGVAGLYWLIMTVARSRAGKRELAKESDG